MDIARESMPDQWYNNCKNLYLDDMEKNQKIEEDDKILWVQILQLLCKNFIIGILSSRHYLLYF